MSEEKTNLLISKAISKHEPHEILTQRGRGEFFVKTGKKLFNIIFFPEDLLHATL
jgi:hypothetical protein